MIDYQFLAMVAVALAVVTRGAVLPVVLMTAVVALVMVAYGAGTRRYQRRHISPTGPGADDTPAPSDSELTRWLSVIDRVLHSKD